MHLDSTFRNKTILENQFTCIAATHTELIELLVCREALEALLNYEGCYALGTLVGRCLSIDNQGRGFWPICNPVP